LTFGRPAGYVAGMARLARVVVPGHPHHVTQRGNRRLPTFFSEEDYRTYLALIEERNPVRAGLVKRAWQWPWSSAAGHVSGRGDVLVRPGGPLAAEVSRWRRFLAAEEDEETLTILRRHGRTGRPWADPRVLARIEKLLSCRLAPGRAGRPRKGP